MTIRPVGSTPPVLRQAAAAPPAPADRFVPGEPEGDAARLARMARLLTERIDLRWTSEVRGALSQPRVAADGTVLAGGFDHRVHGLDPATGASRWSHKTDSHLDDPPAQGPDGRLYATSRDLDLHILSPQGAPLGRVRVGPTTCGPTVDSEGRVFVVTMNGRVQALDADGGPLWSWSLRDPHEPGFMVPPALGPDGTVYCAASGGTVTAFEPATGRELWSVKPGGALYAPPVPGPDGTVYLANLNGEVLALDSASGATRWTAETGSAFHAPALLSGDRLYATNERGLLSCLRTADGSAAWAVPLAGDARVRVESAPMLTPGGTLLAGNGDRDVVALDPSSGEERWRVRLGAAPGPMALSADGETAYVVNGREGLAALPTRSPAQRALEAPPGPPAPPRGAIREAPGFVDVGDVRLPTRG